jgi:mannose-6-phosphate isomerase-like protein (cupin superfamily)
VSYTIKNLHDVDDVAPKFGYDTIQEARFARKDLDAQDTGLAFYRIKPGQHGFSHRHEQAEEVYIVLAGSGRMKLDDDVQDIRAYDAIRVAPQVARAFEAGPEGLEILAVGPHHAGDGEILKGDVWA